jgi:hypothetical protein
MGKAEIRKVMVPSQSWLKSLLSLHFKEETWVWWCVPVIQVMAIG